MLLFAMNMYATIIHCICDDDVLLPMMYRVYTTKHNICVRLKTHSKTLPILPYHYYRGRGGWHGASRSLRIGYSNLHTTIHIATLTH